MEQVCSRRMWNGADGGRFGDGDRDGNGEEDEIVYIGKTHPLSPLKDLPLSVQ